MIKASQVPKEVWKAAWDGYVSSGCTMAEAVAAAINAWPGMRDSQHVSFDGRAENAIVLPLPARSDNA